MGREQTYFSRLLACAAIVCVAGAASAQQSRSITGIVRDEAGEPLMGARIGTLKVRPGDGVHVAATDLNGHFELSFPGNVRQVVVSYVGYEPQTIALTGAASYDIRLKSAAREIGEVVVTGYQTISKERATGSFARIDTRDLETQRLSSVGSLLQGRVAGYQDGRIRGVTSMNGLTTPLYVIDGFPVEKTTNNGYGSWVESVPDLNLEDIESITVLKDAAATSIYGARAANGVVVITTKRAKQSRVNVSFSATLTVNPYSYYTGHMASSADLVGLERSWADLNPNLHGAQEDVAKYAQNLLDNGGLSGGMKAILGWYAGSVSETDMNNTLNGLAAQGFRYFKDLEKYGKRDPFLQQYNLSLSSGGAVNSFNASVTYRKNRLEDKFSENNSLGVNLQNHTQIARWLSLDLGTYLNYGRGTAQTYNLYSPGYSYMPYDALMTTDAQGNAVPFTKTQQDRYSKSDLDKIVSNGLYNLDITPLEEMGMNLKKTRDFSNRSFARLNLKFTDWLNYAVSFQYEYADYTGNQLKDKRSYTVRNYVNSFASPKGGGTSTFNLPYGDIYFNETNKNHSYNFRQQLNFNKTFAGRHEVTAILGNEVRESKLEYDNNTLYNYDPDLLTYSLVDAVALNSIQRVWGWATFSQNDQRKIYELVNRFVSFYGNAAYTYDGRYTVSGSIRWDRTNLFATGSKYQRHPIWSAGAAWNIDKEPFFHVPFVDMLKLRFSYGIGGNIAKNSAPYMTAYYSNNNNVGGIKGTISSRPNPNLRWEKTTTINVGADFALLRGRLNGALDYYNKRGTDLLANTNGVPVEGWGFATYTMNNGEMTNHGVELTLSGDVIVSKDWRWNVTGILSVNKNKVTYVNVKAPILTLVFDYPAAYPRVGNPYNALYGYRYAGLNDKGQPQIQTQDGTVLSDREPSDIEDAVYLGTTVPVYSGSINTSLTYKHWELAVQMLYEGGHKMRRSWIPMLSGGVGMVSKDINNRWQKPGDEAVTDIPAFYPSGNDNYNYVSYSLYSRSSAMVLDATNWRMKNLSVTYHLPAPWCHRLGLQNARLMLGMENVFTIARSAVAKYQLGGYTKPNYLCGLYLNF